MTLLALVIREEPEPVLVNAPQQHHPGRWLSRPGAGRDRHRLGQDLSGSHGIPEPGIELLDRITIDAVLGQDGRPLSYGTNP
jgi:hypothetical protein